MNERILLYRTALILFMRFPYCAIKGIAGLRSKMLTSLPEAEGVSLEVGCPFP